MRNLLSKTWTLNLGTGTAQIATQKESSTKGGKTAGGTSTTRCATYSVAIANGCAHTYHTTSNRLVRYDKLSKARTYVTVNIRITTRITNSIISGLMLRVGRDDGEYWSKQYAYPDSLSSSFSIPCSDFEDGPNYEGALIDYIQVDMMDSSNTVYAHYATGAWTIADGCTFTIRTSTSNTNTALSVTFL